MKPDFRLRRLNLAQHDSLGVTDLVEVINDCIRLSEMDARRHAVKISFLQAEKVLSIAVDSESVMQIILNLFNLSIIAASQAEQAEIHIELVRVYEYAIVWVRNTGPGFSPQALRWSSKRLTDQIGVELSLSRRIAEARGGHLKLSNLDDGGALVTLHLPLAPIHKGEEYLCAKLP